LLEAAGEYGIDLGSSFMVGDRWRDVDAGAAAGCTTVLIDRGYRERSPHHRPDSVVNSIESAVDVILQSLLHPTASE
jgi:D-glycero-D-manno-heptose 1,7-bisphosphate phosphatase